MGFGIPFKDVGDAIASAGQAAGNMVADAGKAVAEGAGAAANAVGHAAGSATEVVGGAAGAAAEAVSGAADAAGEAAAGAMGGAAAAVGGAVGDVAEGAKGLVGGAKNALTSEQVLSILEACYDKSLNGLPGISGPVQELADDYVTRANSIESAAKDLIRAQVVKSGTSGFVTSLGGAITIPPEIASVLYIQFRMVAALAAMRGYDITTDQVRTMVYLCFVGDGAKNLLKEAGVVVGNKIAKTAVKKIPGKVLTAINKKVGFCLVTKLGEKGAINLGKLVPVVGGVIGGGVDAGSTYAVGNLAYKVFIEGELPD